MRLRLQSRWQQFQAWLFAQAMAHELKQAGLSKQVQELPFGRVVYLDNGKTEAKDTLLLLHSAGADKSSWPRLVKALGHARRILLVDLPAQVAKLCLEFLREKEALTRPPHRRTAAPKPCRKFKRNTQLHRKKLMPSFFLILLASFTLMLGNCFAGSYEYEVKTVNYKNLAARLYLPKTSEKVPAVIGFGGSDPSWGFAEANGQMMASNGIAVIGLVYFKTEPGLPATLDHIPMEYFISAIDYAETVKEIDATRIGVVSGSRGSEAGFLLAILDPRIKSVAITTPSKVAWPGVTTSQSAWTYQGRDIPAMDLPDLLNATQVQRFEKALQDQERVKKATFQFEKITGPILLISAENDQIWPGTAMSNDIMAYLKAHNFKYSAAHKSYPTGHGFSQETAPEIKQMIIDHFVRTLKN